MNVGQVAVVTGPPGVGKTTVTRLLADSPQPCVHLQTEDLWSWLRPRARPHHISESEHHNSIILGVAVEAAFGFARGGYDVILDGIIGPWDINRFRQAARAYKIPLRYIVLRPSAEVTLERAANRPHATPIDPHTLAQHYDRFRHLGEYEGNVIDSSGLSPSVTTALVRGAMSAEHTVLWPDAAVRV